MKMLLPLLVVVVFTASSTAQEPSTETPADQQIHDELRALRDRMFEAYSKRDLDALLNDVEDHAVVTWQNGERILNKEEFRAFYNKMMTGDKRIVEDVSSEFTVDGLSLICGDDTAVAYGTCVDQFHLSSGRNLELTSKWTATVVKTDGNWKVASFHISANIFDNPVLDTATNWLTYVGIAGVAIGIVLGFLLAVVLRRKSLPASP